MPSEAFPATTRVVLPADPIAVREALCALFDRLTTGPMADDARDAAQIVLAEALNNIVEHAYAQFPGEIEVMVEVCPKGIRCTIADSGRPMPDGCLPEGQLDLPCAGSDLPEGGFGWGLIRTLSQDLAYQRIGARNLLSFRIDSKQSAH